MAIPVKLEVFEGPLDLLLHLIDKNKVDIYDIPIGAVFRLYQTDGNRRYERDERVSRYGGDIARYQVQDASAQRSK